MTAQELVDSIPSAQFAAYARGVRDRILGGDETTVTLAILRAVNVREAQELQPLDVMVIRGQTLPESSWKVLLIIAISAFAALKRFK